MLVGLLCTVTPGARAQETLTLLKKYDLGVTRYTEGLDFYNGFLWHTARHRLFRLDLDSAVDTDGDGDYDLQPDRTWVLTHHNHSESSVWLNGELFNFTYLDTLDNLSDDIFKLNLNDDETYQWQHAGVGLGTTNWGSCRDRRHPGQWIIYTGHYDNVLMWFDPGTGNTTEILTVAGMDDIEDLGMDRYATVWTSSFNSDVYPGLFRLDPETGEVLETYLGPDGLAVIDGMAIRSLGDQDLMYVTGKNIQYIWEYQVPEGPAGVTPYDLAGAVLELHPNYPNPFASETQIRYYVPATTRVRLGVYDVTGRLVTELENGIANAGLHTVTWEAGQTASNDYFLRLDAGGTVLTRRMLLLR